MDSIFIPELSSSKGDPADQCDSGSIALKTLVVFVAKKLLRKDHPLLHPVESPTCRRKSQILFHRVKFLSHQGRGVLGSMASNRLAHPPAHEE